MTRSTKTPAEALVAIMIEATEDLERFIRNRRLRDFPVAEHSVLESPDVRAFLAADRPWTRMEWDWLLETFEFATRISDETGDVADEAVAEIHARLETATDVACRFIGDMLYGADEDSEAEMTDEEEYPRLLFPA
ncbi:hypothetical protein [Sutterella sp.]|uniref:hypothetical protein n=1 Tax=Sutterella sp. TaxID=1981025 RepID=UPI0026DFC46C|nr:hypothetical protein [Sutterella sp.]MDO5531879.1 hypothetical protein [Sutterella sp.]